jgi:hypothetical protein
MRATRLRRRDGEAGIGRCLGGIPKRCTRLCRGSGGQASSCSRARLDHIFT